MSDISVGAIHESPAVQLTKMGLIVKSMIDTLPDRFENLAVDAYVIMPNHIHLLLRIEEGAIHESPLREKGKRSLLGKAIGYLKMNSSKRIHECHPSLEIWQRGYYEHVIRNESDYREIWNYIDQNPAKWSEDRYFETNS